MKLLALTFLASSLAIGSAQAQTLGDRGRVTEDTTVTRHEGHLTPFGWRPTGSQCILKKGDGIEVVANPADGKVLVQMTFSKRLPRKTLCSRHDAAYQPADKVKGWVEQLAAEAAAAKEAAKAKPKRNLLGKKD